MWFRTKKQVMDIYERQAWTHKARQIAYDLIIRNGSITVDELRAELTKKGLLPKRDLRCLGGVLHCREFEKIAYDYTRIKTSHARPIGVFVLR